MKFLYELKKTFTKQVFRRNIQVYRKVFINFGLSRRNLDCPTANVNRLRIDAMFASAVRSIAEQLNKCLSVNPDISLNLGHKTNADRFTAMNGHNRAPPIRVLFIIA